MPASNFNDITITGVATQSTAATGATELVRKGEMDTALGGKVGTSDASVTNSRAPNGAAGGDLTGSYPNPTLAAIVTANASGANKVAYDAKGRITGEVATTEADVPVHAAHHKSGGSDPIRTDELAVPTADVSMNSHKLTSVQDPASAQDAATKNYVDGRRLDQAAAPTASVPLNTQKITGLADPASAQDAATKAYVDGRRLDQIAAPTADVSLSSHKLTNVTDPASAQDAATKSYVDAAVQGLGNKAAVRMASTGNLSLTGLAAIDGVTPIATDRVLVKDQTTASQNGIYTAASGAWTRATDADISAEVKAGLYVFVTEGTTNGDSGWSLTTNDPIVLGTTALVFTQFTGAGQISAGAGLVKSGNSLSADFATTATAGKVTEANDPRLNDSRQMAAAIANIDANSHKVINMTDPTLAQDAATKAYVDGRKISDLLEPTVEVSFNDNLITNVLNPVSAQDAATKAYVDARRLDQAAVPTGPVAMGTQKITGLADPTLAQDAATKAYVDAQSQGLDVKASCRIGSTANLSLSGLAAIDGVTPVANDRVLVKDQTTASQNGIYTAASGAWARATDADTSAKVTAGLFTFVTEGTANADSGWVLTTNDPIVLATTSLAFTQFSGAGQVTAGSGIVKSGNTLSADFASTATAGKVCQANDARLSDARQMAAATGSVDANTHKVINVTDPTSSQDAATKIYVDNGDRTGNLVWVDAINGSDSTGARGKANLPFLTLLAAKAAASSGDTIIVLPGTYSELNLLKNGVNWHFLPGTKVNPFSGSGAIFDDTAAGCICKITGWCDFRPDDHNILTISNSGSDIEMEAILLKAEGTAKIAAISGGTVRIRAPRMLSSGAGFDIVPTVAATVVVTADELVCDNGIAIHQLAGTSVFNVRQISAGSYAVHMEGGSLDINGRILISTAAYAVFLQEDSTAFLTISGCTIQSTLALATGKAVYVDGGNNMVLRDCTLVSNVAGTPATVSIDATAAYNVRIYGSCMANLAKGANITFITGSTRFEVDADVR